MGRLRPVGELAVVVGSCALWGGWTAAVVDDPADAIILLGALLIGPAWAYAFCWASEPDDFPGDASRGRSSWMRILPWTFLLAPLVVPNIVLLVQFFRDARADHGQTWLGSGRSRPGEGEQHLLR